jgi:hypothetical protein
MSSNANEMDFIKFIRLWDILLNGDFKQKLKLLFVVHLKGKGAE